ncbi:unnamed protein product, partial [Ectocarpus sp. 12 AP-2014]
AGLGTPAAPAVHGCRAADSVGKGKAGCWPSPSVLSGAVAGTVRGTSLKRKDMAADDRRGEVLEPCLDDATPPHPVKKRRVGHDKGPQRRQSFLPPLDSRGAAAARQEVLAWSSTIAALDNGGVGGVAGVSGGGGGGLGTLHADGDH